MMINYTVKRQTWRINKQNILVNFHIIQYVGRRRRRRFVVFLFRWWRSFIRNRFTHFYLDALRPSFFSCIFLFWLFENDYIDFDCAIVAFIVGFAILCLIALINLFINQEPPIPEMLYIIFSQRYTWHDLLIHYWIHTTTIKTHKRTQRIIFCSLIYIYLLWSGIVYIWSARNKQQFIWAWCWSHVHQIYTDQAHCCLPAATWFQLKQIENASPM